MNKMDKFVKLTVPIMRHQIGLLLPVAAATDPTLDGKNRPGYLDGGRGGRSCVAFLDQQ